MNHQITRFIVSCLFSLVLKIESVGGLQCYICGTQPFPNEMSQEFLSMRPDPCWETDSKWDQYSCGCSEDCVCVKIVTRDADDVVHIQRSCTRSTMNFYEHKHRLGCGPLRSLNTDTSYSDGVACFCDTDYCNFANQTCSHVITHIVLLLIVSLLLL